MIRTDFRHGVIHASVVAYRVLLVAYPAAFRREYGGQMLQVFGTACRQSAESSGPSRLGSLWLRALGDLVVSACAERWVEMRRQETQRRQYLYLGAVLLSVITGYVHLILDADGLVIALLLAGAFLCGVAHPAGAWRWALIAGLGIPIALLIGHGSSAAVFAHRDTDLAWPVPLIPTVAAAYCGVMIHRLFPRRGGTFGSEEAQSYQ